MWVWIIICTVSIKKAAKIKDGFLTENNIDLPIDGDIVRSCLRILGNMLKVQKVPVGELMSTLAAFFSLQDNSFLPHTSLSM